MRHIRRKPISRPSAARWKSGGVSREVFSDQSSKFRWSIGVVDTGPVMGWENTVDEAKAALERAWFDWAARAGLRDDPNAPAVPPVKDRG